MHNFKFQVWFQGAGEREWLPGEITILAPNLKEARKALKRGVIPDRVEYVGIEP